MQEHQVILHTVGVYSINTAKGSEVMAIHDALDEIAEREPYVLQVHGLYVDDATQAVFFDLVIAFEADNRETVRKRVEDEMHGRFPHYAFMATIDSDISD
jgi:hypothetical protein